MSDIFEQSFKDVVEETQCLLELSETDARLIFNAGKKAAVEHCKQGEPIGYLLTNGAFTQNMNEVSAHDIRNADKALPLFTNAMPKSEESAITKLRDLYLRTLCTSEKIYELTTLPIDELRKILDSAEATPQPSTDVSDAQLESLIENSGGHWVEDEFRVNGADLMNLLRAIAKHTVK